ncbi:MAG: hypothetical protein QOI56_412, partial [Actinomycetota bacterium]|nr:hypothetical protein [Actinomycetota bacterium]
MLLALSALVVLVATPASAAPTNDNFVDATLISGPSGTVTGTNDSATVEVGEPDPGGFTVNSSIWYVWAPPTDGLFTFDTCGSSFDTVLAVYTGSAVDALTEVAANDDACLAQSSVTFTATFGTTYHIVIASLGPVAGPTVLSWAQVLPPPNDDFASATTIVGPSGTVTGSNVLATKEIGEPDHAGATGGASIWYRWVAPATDTFTFETCSDNAVDTQLAVYTGIAVDALSPVASDDNGCGSQSRVTFDATAGTTYSIAVDGDNGFGPSTGTIVLHWVQAPPNDDFANATPVSGASGSVSGTTEGATKEPGEPDHAGNVGGHSVWYAWTAPANAEVVFDTCTAEFDTTLAVYQGPLGSPAIVSNDQGTCVGSNFGSTVTFTATAGTVYDVAVDGFFLPNLEGPPPFGTYILTWQMIGPAAPTIATQATPPSAPFGTPIHDVATLSGALNPTGTVTFSLYDTSSCSAPPIFTSPDQPVVGDTASSGAYTPALTGTYSWVAAFSGDPGNLAVTGACDDADEQVAVNPTITTQAVPTTAVVGQPVRDVATVSGTGPFGPVTFTLSSDPACTSVVFTSPNHPLVGGTATSDAFVPLVPGTYRWVAAAAATSTTPAVSGTCGDVDEDVVVVQDTPTLTTQATPTTAASGQSVHDVATVSGGISPSGTVSFALYADAACTAPAVFTSPGQPPAAGTAVSPDVAPAAPGTYHWVATYSGDIANAAVTGACDDPNEQVTVTRATPTITTQATPTTAFVLDPIHDVATLSGGASPTGTVTFVLYGDQSCSVPVTTSAGRALLGGIATSDDVSPQAPGTYHWVASYSGDDNNAAVSGACNDPNESVVVSSIPSRTTTSTVPISSTTTTSTVPPPTTTT